MTYIAMLAIWLSLLLIFSSLHVSSGLRVVPKVLPVIGVVRLNRNSRNYKNSFAPSRLLASLGKANIDEMIYSPPPYLLDLIRQNPDRTRWMVADISQNTGIELRKAEKDLMALAILTGAQLEVTKQGDILYSFPLDIESRLRDKSIRHRLDKFIAKVYPHINHLYRISFGVMLLSSLAIVYVAFVVAMSSSASSRDDEDNDSRGRNRRHHHHRRHLTSQSGGIHIHLDMFDLLYLFNRSNTDHRQTDREQLSFLRSIYSFLFGEGDPNAKHDIERLFPAAVKYIQRQQGFVTSEELALFLPSVPSPLSKTENVDSLSTATAVSESFVLPFLLRYGGTPRLVDDTIIYHFPDLAVMNSLSASRKNNNEEEKKIKTHRKNQEFAQLFQRTGDTAVPLAEHEIDQLLEIEPQFTKATPAQVSQAMLLGTANGVGVWWLGQFLRRNAHLVRNMSPHFAFWRSLHTLYPFLALYAIAYALTPPIRLLLHQKEKKQVQERNRRRRSWYEILRNPSKVLKEKWRARHQLREEISDKEPNNSYQIDENYDDNDRSIIYDSNLPLFMQQSPSDTSI